MKLILLLAAIALTAELSLAQLTSDEQCWGQLAEIQHPRDTGATFDGKYPVLSDSITGLLKNIGHTQSRPVSHTLTLVDKILATVPWSKSGSQTVSSKNYPPPAYTPPDHYNWQLMLGRLGFLTTGDWAEHCAAILQTDGFCPSKDHAGLQNWSQTYSLVHSIRDATLKERPYYPEALGRVSDGMVEAWDYFHGISSEVVASDVARGCVANPEREARQREFCTGFLPKLKQVLVMQLCHQK